jgi:hypothetical protein
MTTYQFVIALVTGVPALLTSIAAFYHSFDTKAKLTRRLNAVEDKMS